MGTMDRIRAENPVYPVILIIVFFVLVDYTPLHD